MTKCLLLLFLFAGIFQLTSTKSSPLLDVTCKSDDGAVTCSCAK